jgi:hypothetical protein
VVSTRELSFVGTTCPGCRVTVGDSLVADVETDGVWRLGLTLEPGDNATTIEAVEPATGLATSRVVQVRYEPPLHLSQWADLSPVDCGTPYEDATASLSVVLGTPDRIDVSAQPEDPAAADEVEWRWVDGGITVMFDTYSLCTMGDEIEEFYQLVGWEIWGDTAGLSVGGIAPGSTVADLMVLEDDRDRCERSRREGRSGEQGCITISETPNDEGTYDFSRSQGLMPPNLYGTVDGNDLTGRIITIASRAP